MKCCIICREDSRQSHRCRCHWYDNPIYGGNLLEENSYPPIPKPLPPPPEPPPEPPPPDVSESIYGSNKDLKILKTEMQEIIKKNSSILEVSLATRLLKAAEWIDNHRGCDWDCLYETDKAADFVLSELVQNG